MQAFINGAFVDLGAATVPALDAGFQHAVGLFETMLGGVRDGKPWVVALDEHTERLAASAAALDLSPDLRAAALADAVLATVERSGLARARVKLTVTGGDLNLLARGGAEAKRVDPTILITTQPATVYPEAMLRAGVAAAVADARANNFDPTQGHKTLAYWWRLRELQGAGRKGAAEALVFDATNHLAGGCVSNAFVVKDGVVYTPIARGEEGFGPAGPTGEAEEMRAAGRHLPSPVLPGVTRAWVIDQLGLKGARVERRMVTIDDVLGADELFLTNSSWGVLPVVQLEARAIGQRTPGPVTAGLVDAWREWVG
ncbi:MAG TPA: aminotransferase class IV [Phycisphaerales bacterium]|nr:aminotransferase class IV [Phycisphaerales bacterium]